MSAAIDRAINELEASIAYLELVLDGNEASDDHMFQIQDLIARLENIEL